jgi:hypothetical protein
MTAEPRGIESARGTTRTRVNKKRIELAEMEGAAMQMAIEGVQYREIAERQGCSISTAHDRVHRALAEITLAPATELKQMEDERLCALVLALWPVAMAAGPQQVEAVRELRRLSESRRKLHGLDAPARRSIEVFEHDAFSVMVGRLEAELAVNDPQAASVSGAHAQ